MKKVLHATLLLFFLSSAHQLIAQCTVSNFTVTVKSIKSVSTGCELTVDLSFTGSFNDGNKYAFIHLWESDPINNYPNLGYNNPPTKTQLASALGTIVIASPGKSNAQLYNSYPVPGNATTPVLYTGVTFSKTGNGPYNFKLSNVKLQLSSCAESVSIKGDVWASQSNDAQNVHCFNKGQINFQFTNPLITGTLLCEKPRRYSITLDNTNSSAGISATYKVYWDDGDGIFEPLTPVQGATKDVLVNQTALPVAVAAGGMYTSPLQDYAPYSAQNPDASHVLFIDATTTSVLGTISYTGLIIENACQLLPVKFSSFTAARNGQNKQQVDISWTTATEQNNRGFYVQRKTEGEWKDVAFVFSAADGGNSSSPLAYRFKDKNTYKGLSQYRLLQVDLNGKATASEAKTVAGETQTATEHIYPNPSVNGTINLAFSDNSVKDITLSDLNGRTLKQYRQISSSSLTIPALKRGFYTIRITHRTTGETTVEKVVVR